MSFLRGSIKKMKRTLSTPSEDVQEETKRPKLEEEKETTPFFLFFDTETDGNGSFRNPFTQTVVQVAWSLTDKQGNVLDCYKSFVSGATVLEYNPNAWTLEQINGPDSITPELARDKFMDAVAQVKQNDGYIVAHNLEFDIDAMQSLGVTGLNTVNQFCTKVNTTNICKIPAAYGSRFKRNYKWPSQTELNKHLFPDAIEVQTHDAGDDVAMLRKNFLECMNRCQKNRDYKKFRF